MQKKNISKGKYVIFIWLREWLSKSIRTKSGGRSPLKKSSKTKHFWRFESRKSVFYAVMGRRPVGKPSMSTLLRARTLSCCLHFAGGDFWGLTYHFWNCWKVISIWPSKSFNWNASLSEQKRLLLTAILEEELYCSKETNSKGVDAGCWRATKWSRKSLNWIEMLLYLDKVLSSIFKTVSPL